MRLIYSYLCSSMPINCCCIFIKLSFNIETNEHTRQIQEFLFFPRLNIPCKCNRSISGNGIVYRINLCLRAVGRNYCTGCGFRNLYAIRKLICHTAVSVKCILWCFVELQSNRIRSARKYIITAVRILCCAADSHATQKAGDIRILRICHLHRDHIPILHGDGQIFICAKRLQTLQLPVTLHRGNLN